MYNHSKTYILKQEDILRWLRRFQHDDEFRADNGAKTVPIASLCDFAGVCRRSVYYFTRGQRDLSDDFRLRLTDAISAVEQGLRWRKIKNGTTVIVDPERWGNWKTFPRMNRGRPKFRSEVSRGG